MRIEKRFRTTYTAGRTAMAFALALAFAGGAWAQDQSGSGASDDELFGAEEVTEAAPAAEAPQASFLKYDQVKVGGSISGSLGGSAVWLDPWNSGLGTVDDHYLSPGLSAKVTLTAKPAEDFGVNLDFRMSYPFSTTTTVSSVKPDNPATFDIDESMTGIGVPNISVWAAYAKFSLWNSVFMSFGKQPIAWGVSKGFFQPADDIFAMTVVDYSDTGAEREGPLAFKAMLPIPLTMANVYFYAGLPSTDYTDFGNLRVAAKAEINVGNTELAIGGFYAYNDYPRGLLMVTTGTGDFNFFGEGVLKYGSERYFIDTKGSSNPMFWTASQASDRFYFTGTLGGYYTDSNANLTIMAQVLYNGEGQSGVTAEEAFTYYMMHSAQVDRMKLNTWYAGASISKSELFTEDLSAGAYAIADLSDLSAFVSPYLSYSLSDYMSVQLSATFTLGEEGDEYILMGPDFRHAATGPGTAVSLTFTLGSGSF
jgi:hypothetical protein